MNWVEYLVCIASALALCYADCGFKGTVGLIVPPTYNKTRLFRLLEVGPQVLFSTLSAPESTDPVTDNVSLISGVALRYASALIDLAEEQGVIAEVEAGLYKFEALMNECEDLDRLIKSPAFTAEVQLKALTAVLEKAGITGLTANFVKLVAENQRLFALRSMINGFRVQLAERRGEVTAHVTTAQELSDEHIATLREAINASEGKNVNIAAKVDPSIIGGLIVKIGSRMVDASLRTKLNSLKFAMKEVG